jgi:D-amino-acid dehydrogenase
MPVFVRLALSFSTNKNMSSIGIIGAGVTGVTTAYYLAKMGYSVVVYDKHPYSGMQTSYANGGQLSVSNAEVWTSWPTVKKGLKWMFKKDAPLLFNLSPSMPKYKWIAGFLMNTVKGQSNFDKYTKLTIEYGLAARELYYEIAEEEGIHFDLLKKGILHFYRDKKTFDAAIQSCEYFKSAGVDRHVVTADEVVKLEPALAPISHTILGGTYTPDDASGDIHVFCHKLTKVLQERYGVVFKYDTTVTDILTYNSHVNVTTLTNKSLHEIDVLEQVIVCAGVDSNEFAHMVGDSVNVYPVKGYSITIPLESGPYWDSAPTISLLDEATKIVSSRLGDRLRVAGTAELADWNYDIRQDRIKPLTDWVRTCFPDVSVKNAVPWAGLRPMTATMFPVVRHAKTTDRVLFNTGHGHLGWTLAAATAKEIAELIWDQANLS